MKLTTRSFDLYLLNKIFKDKQKVSRANCTPYYFYLPRIINKYNLKENLFNCFLFLKKSDFKKIALNL